MKRMIEHAIDNSLKASYHQHKSSIGQGASLSAGILLQYLQNSRINLTLELHSNLLRPTPRSNR